MARSAQELAAAKARSAANTAKKMPVPIQPVKAPLPKAVQSKTPAAKIMSAQKSQPVYGPAVPKDYKKPDYSSAFSSLPKNLGKTVIPVQSKTVLPKLDDVKNYQPSKEEKRLNKMQADPAVPTKAQLDKYASDSREKVLQSSNRDSSQHSERSTFTQSERNASNPTIKETAVSRVRSIAEIPASLGKLAGQAGSYIAKKLGKGSLADTIAKKTSDNPLTRFATPKTAGEEKAMAEFDTMSGLAVPARTGQIASGVGRIVNKAISKGVSPSGIGKLIKVGESGAFKNTMEGVGKLVTRDSQIRSAGNASLGESIASGTASAIRPKRALASDIPAEMQSVPKIASEITPEARIASVADNVPQVDNLAVAKRTMASGANADEVIKNIPEVPKGNHGRRNEIFTEPDHAGKEKVFMNVDDGGKELKKIEVGEVDAEGKVIEKMSEDGRPMSEVITEAQNNLEHGKRLVKLDTPSGTVRNVVREGKKGKLSLNGIQTKMNAARDAKVAKIAEDANIQDHIKSKIEKLKAAMEGASDPQTRMRLEAQLNDEISILRDYPKMSAEDRQFFKERTLRENPAVGDAIIRDYQDARSFKAPVVAETAPTKDIFGGTLKGFIKNPLAKVDTPKEVFDPKSYVKEMVRKQRDAEGKTGILSKLGSFLGEFEFKKKMIETNAPIEDVIAQAQKKFKFEAIPRHDMTNQIDRVYRAQSMAGQFAKENGLEGVIHDVKDLDEFDQYLIAKHGQSLAAQGIKTGRDAEKDAMFIQAVGDKYAKQEKVVRDYSHKLLDYAVESGLISKETAKNLKVKYPDYVPYQRIFGEDEEVAKGFGGKGVANLGKQTVVQGIKGSEREVKSPMKSFLEKTTDAFVQGEKNKAAQILTSHHNIPGNPFGLEKIANGAKHVGDSTISVFKNGTKEIWKVNKDVAEAAKAMNVQQIGLLGKIFAFPVRAAKVGITGINLPFVAANVAKDIVSAFVNSKESFRALTTMPRALFEAVGHQKLYQEMVKEGAMQTSFDIARNQVSPTIRNARGLLGNKGIERVKYIADTPAKLFRAVEDIVGRSEEFNRISQYKAAYDASIKRGMKPIDARAVAARAARETTTNFARKGEWGSAMNVLVLYLNAGIQGSRTLVRNIATRPAATATKIVTVVGMPMAITTAWNLNDPKRKAAYEDIPEFEKENNFILIPDNPQKDKDGKWDVIKVPITPGLSNMVQPIRYALERANGMDPQSFAEMANVLSGSVSPVQIPVDADTTRKTISQLTPQAIKPTIEAQTNRDSFTGAPIIPRKLEGLAPELQVKDNTSGTAKILGEQLNASPLQVEHFVKSTFGSVGLQVLNASDKALAATGKISPEDIGGQEVFDAIFARFGKAAGGAVEQKQWSQEAQASQEDKSQKYVAKQEFQPTYDKIKQLTQEGKDAEASKIIDSLDENQVKQFQKAVTAEKKKATEDNKRKMTPVANKLSDMMKAGDDQGVSDLIDSLTDEEVHALGLVLGIKL